MFQKPVYRWLHAFRFAWNGFWQALCNERNLKFHLFIAFLVVLLGWWLEVTRLEWCLILLCIGAVISAELFNSAIEKTLDRISTEIHPDTGLAKDIAAAAVLIASLTAAGVGLLVFIPALLQKMNIN